MQKGDRIRDTVTGSVWTIVQINVIEPQPGKPVKWHNVESDKGARRRILTGELEERYVRDFS